jgi:hypothetical protein
MPGRRPRRLQAIRGGEEGSRRGYALGSVLKARQLLLINCCFASRNQAGQLSLTFVAVFPKR